MHGLLKLALLAAATTGVFARPAADNHNGAPSKHAPLTAKNALAKYPAAKILGKGVEGASVDKDGEIYACDGKSLYKLSQDAANAKAFATGGTTYASSRFTSTGVLIGDATNQTVYSVPSAGKPRTNLFPPVDGMLQPNDFAISGCEKKLYLSGMNYTANTGDLWYHNTQTKATKKVDLSGGKLYRINGIELSPDDKTLYVTSAQNSADGKSVLGAQIWKFKVGADGMPSEPKMAIDLYGILQKHGFNATKDGMDPDGMRMDKSGNLFVTLNAIQKVLMWDPKKPISYSQVIELETVKFPSNLELGGTDGKTLVVIGRCAANETTSCVDSYQHNVPGRAFFNLNKSKAPSSNSAPTPAPTKSSSSVAADAEAATKTPAASPSAPAATGSSSSSGDDGSYRPKGDDGSYGRWAKSY